MHKGAVVADRASVHNSMGRSVDELGRYVFCALRLLICSTIRSGSVIRACIVYADRTFGQADACTKLSYHNIELLSVLKVERCADR